MKRGRLGVVRAMILASLSACSFLAACGSAEDDLFDGISESELNSFGYIVIDDGPSATPGISEDEAITAAQNSASVVIDARLLVMHFERFEETSQHLTWAIQVDPATGHLLGGNIAAVCSVVGAEAAIIFIDAVHSHITHCYARPIGGFPPDTPYEAPSYAAPEVTLGWPAALAVMNEGLQFLDPGDHPDPDVTGPEAVAIAIEAGMTVRNVEFGRLLDANADPPVDALAWAMELDDGVAFVDATTGEILYRFE